MWAKSRVMFVEVVVQLKYSHHKRRKVSRIVDRKIVIKMSFELSASRQPSTIPRGRDKDLSTLFA